MVSRVSLKRGMDDNFNVCKLGADWINSMTFFKENRPQSMTNSVNKFKGRILLRTVVNAKELAVKFDYKVSSVAFGNR